MTWWVAGAVVVGTVASGSMQADAANNAADAQSDAARSSDATQRYFYDTTRTDNMPFLQTGYKANDSLANLLSSGALNPPTFDKYQQDPSYQYQQNEAARILQNSAAARGGLYSGATMKALGRQAQNLANADYGNWWNRQTQGASNQINQLNAIRSGGQVAAGQVGAAGANAANQISSNQQALGNALGANSIAQGNILANGINSFTSYGNQNNWFRQQHSGIDSSGQGSLYQGGGANGSLNGVYGIYGD